MTERLLIPLPTPGNGACEASFETSDFYLACFLRCRGYRLSRVTGRGSRRTFQFDRPSDMDREILSYVNAEAEVPAVAFVGVIREMKSLLHSMSGDAHEH
jgi:hypothetical protein